MSPEEVVWEGQALALSSENSEGDYDILPGHANFMTLIKGTSVTLLLEDNKEESFTFEHAVLFFDEDKARIYIHTSAVLGKEKGGKV